MAETGSSMETPSTQRKRRGLTFPAEENRATALAGELNFSEMQPQPENLPENVQETAVFAEDLDDTDIRPAKRTRFEIGSPQNPVLLDDEDENGNNKNSINCVQNEESKAVPDCEITVIQSDNDEEAAAAVTVQKSLSRRVKKKMTAAAEQPLQLRVSPRLQGRSEAEKPVYFPVARIVGSKLKESNNNDDDDDDNSQVHSSSEGLDSEKTASERVTQSDGAVQSDVAPENATSAQEGGAVAEVAKASGVEYVLGLTAGDMLNPAAAASPTKENRVPNNVAGKSTKGKSTNSSPSKGNSAGISASRKRPRLAEASGDSSSSGGGGAAGVQSSTRNNADTLEAAPDKSISALWAPLDESSGAAARAKVKDTLRIFNGHILRLSKGADGTQEERNSARRPDLKAIKEMRLTNVLLNKEKRPGHIPGVNVGEHFFSRCEMVAIGLHAHWLNGIDYMGQSYQRNVEYKGYQFPIAVAIVLSGQYEDDVDNAEEVVYTGQGGHDLLGNKRQIKDQEMTGGNEALKNCISQKIPVRVIRGHKSANSYTGKVYTYDGLYQVVRYWADKGVSGFTIYKYCLRRLGGQPVLTTDQVHFSRGQIPQSTSGLRGLVCEDISNGQEPIPIPVTNVIDDPPVPPTGYTYLKSIKVAKGVDLPPPGEGCNCKGECIDPKKCSCARRNGGDFPYVRSHGGRLVQAKDVVYECGPNCGCGPNCVNRTSQQGLRYRLEIFRTPNKGWAVRSWDSIPAGAPVCEYTGLLVRTDDLLTASDNNFIFEIDCLQTMNGIDGRQRRLGDVSNHEDIQVERHDKKVEPDFGIDAGTSGGVARFINHCCDPNLFVQCVLSSHHDCKLARVMLFASDNIPPLQELTYDYGYPLDSVVDEEGKIKKMPCYCGAVDCRGRLY